MHEMSLCRALISSAERELIKHSGRRLQALKVCVGALSGCEPALLAHLFPHAAQGTMAEGAELTIEFQAARVRCTACKKPADVAPNQLCCPACGSPAVQLIEGDGVFLTGLVLREVSHVQ